MATKRVAPKTSASSSATPRWARPCFWEWPSVTESAPSSPEAGLTWPPDQLLASTFTVAGCLALIGPILLFRRESSEIGLGELLWMAGGLVIWVFDLAALTRGDARSLSWATPLGYQPMGLTILAVLLATWRGRVAGSSWSWTNVVGWSLGIFWVAMAASTLIPSRLTGLAMR